MSEVIVSCKDIYKQYPILPPKGVGLKQLLSTKKNASTFTALCGINMELLKGEVIGFIGLNGSGKSTLSRIIAGISYPSSGTVNVKGTVSMLSTRSGMNNYLTGRENIYYKCLLLGFDYKHIKSIENKIIEFAELEEFIDQPLENYSSGMQARLGFAISIHICPDILIVDEALSVGDSSFMEKCLAWMDQYRASGNSIIYVSHSVAQMQDFCDRILWLHNGKCVGFDTAQRLVPSYNTFAKAYTKMSKEEKKACQPRLLDYVAPSV